MKKTLILLILLAFAYGAKAQTFTYKNLTAKDSLKSKYFFLSDGAQNGYILKSDANGKASWQAVPAGGIDSFYLKMVCNISSLEGWKFSSDTMYVDTCGQWRTLANYLQPKDMTKAVNSDSGYYQFSEKVLWEVRDTSTGISTFNVKPSFTDDEGYFYSFNTNVGVKSGLLNTGMTHLNIGYNTGYNNTGENQIAIGSGSGSQNTGTDQIVVGYNTGLANIGNIQIAIGSGSGSQNIGNSQIAIGTTAGAFNHADSVIQIGVSAGFSDLDSSKLNRAIYIGIGDSSRALLFGQNSSGILTDGRLKINGSLWAQNLPVGDSNDSIVVGRWLAGSHQLRRVANTIPSTSGIASQIADSLASCRNNLSVYNLNSCIGNVIIANDTLKSTRGFLAMKSYTGSSSVPAFGWNDGYGMYRAGSALYLTQGGTNRALFNSVGISCAATAGTPSMRTQGGYSATTPCFVSYNQNTFGMGFSAANTINLITSSKTALQISSAGQSRFGAGATNNITIDTVNAIRLNGSSTVWEDLVVPFTTAVTGSSSYPAFNEDSLYYTFYVDSVSPNDCFKFFIVQMPHRWKEGSNIYPHVHYKHTTAQGTPTFTMRYKWINIGATTAGVPWSYKDLNATTGTTNNTHQMNYTTTPISGTGKTISSILLIRLYLKSQTGSTDINAWQFDLHYEIDSMGSNAEDVK